jgi:hypothetical protein
MNERKWTTRDVIGLVLAILAVAVFVAWTGTEATKYSTMQRSASTRAWQDGIGQVVGIPAKVTGGAKSYCAAITATTAQTTLATTTTYFRICATGGTASVTFGSNPTATTAVNGHDLIVGDGMCHTIEVTDAKAAVIGGYNGGTATAGGEICFLPLVSPGGTP